MQFEGWVTLTDTRSSKQKTPPNYNNKGINMTMYNKNNKVNEEREFFAGLFLIPSFVCLWVTPVLLLVGLVPVGIITGIIAMVSGVIGLVIAPEEYKK